MQIGITVMSAWMAGIPARKDAFGDIVSPGFQRSMLE
jgi:hypothetical protein